MKSSYSNSTGRDNQDVRDTSQEAFTKKQHHDSYESETQKTLSTLATIQPATRGMISDRSGIPINKICQYIKVLLQKDLIQESKDKRPCRLSGQKAYYLRLKPIEGIQKNLFD